MTRFTLTTRLVWEVCQKNGTPFSSYRTLCQRLKKLCDAGLIQREQTYGEYIYALTKYGAEYLEIEHGLEVPKRASTLVRPLLQAHELDLTRYWIKFLDDAGKIGVPLVDFYRDGQFVSYHRGKKLMPDGVVLLRIRGKVRAFFLEMDRSTQTSGAGGSKQATFRKKLEHYRFLSRHFRHHDQLKAHHVTSIRLMVVCQNEKRLESLRTLARSMGLDKQCAFTCWTRLIVVTDPHKASGWNYLLANFLAAPLFSFPARSPPASLLLR